MDIGASVSRVGEKTQLPAYRQITSDLKLTYSQFTELEIFTTFSAQLDESTKKILETGKRIRKILNQPQYQPMDASHQIAVLMAVLEGAFDRIDLEQMDQAEKIVIQMAENEPEFRGMVESSEKIDSQWRDGAEPVIGH